MAIDGNIVQEFIDAIKEPPTETNRTYSATVSRVDSEGAVWVHLVGSEQETPTALSASEVKTGDMVNVEWRNNRLYIASNVTDPSAGVQRVGSVEKKADVANEMATDAAQSASVARAAADSAIRDAQIAQESAEQAQELAEYIDVTTYGSVIYYYTHTVSGEDVTETVYKNSEGEYYYLDGTDEIPVAEEDLDREEDTIKTGRADNGLNHTVEEVMAYAQGAKEDADAAAQSAESASKSAYTAIYHLSEVEKVVDVLEWLAKHGQYIKSEDAEYVEGKYYFSVTGTAVDDPTDKHLSSYYELDDGVYVLTEDTQVDVTKTYYTLTTSMENDTTESPSTEGWYELKSVDKAVSDYISTHLALMDDGLWVQMDNAGARLQITDSGIYLHNGGDIIAQYTEDIVLGDEDGVHIKLSTGGGLEFYQGENSVAYMTENKLFIRNSEITESLRIGQFLWIIRSANRISLRYEPIQED